MDRRQIALIFIFLLPSCTSFADNPASQDTLNKVMGASILTPTDWNNLCPTGQTLGSLSGCIPNINGAQQAAVSKLLRYAHIPSISGIPITDNNGIIVFHIAGLSNTGYTVHNNSPNYALCMGFPLDDYPNEPAYTNPNANPLYQYSILNSTSSIAPGATFAFTPLNFYDYYGPNSVNAYMVCVGGTTRFNNASNPSPGNNNSNGSIVGLVLTSP